MRSVCPRRDRASRNHVEASLVSRSFLELILHDENLYDYDVFSFRYRSKYIRGAPIENAAKQLYSAIETLAPLNIVLIAHSMGGLVCMRYILDRLELSEIPPITGLLLYGTPTTGSELVNVAKLVGFGLGVRLPIIRGLTNLFFRGQRQVADLARGSEFLARLHDGWALRVVNGGHEKAGTGRMWLPTRVVTGEDDTLCRKPQGRGCTALSIGYRYPMGIFSWSSRTPRTIRAIFSQKLSSDLSASQGQRHS